MSANTGTVLTDQKKDAGLRIEKAISKNIELAYRRGKGAEAFSSWERQYLLNVAHDDCYAIAYNQFCYIFDVNGLCITLYALPAWFGKKKRFEGKNHIRDYKRFRKNYSNSCIEIQ